MKKLIVVLVTMVLAVSVAFAATSYTSSKGTATESTTTTDFPHETSSTTPIVNHGDVSAIKCAQPVLVTSIGQATDVTIVSTALKRNKNLKYDFKASIDPKEVLGYKTVIISVGMSSKGLGAGVTTDDELARGKEVVKLCKENNIQVILVHIGGQPRRGVGSDTITKYVADVASYMIVLEDANWDGMFTNLANEKKIPLTYINAQKSLVNVFTTLFK